MRSINEYNARSLYHGILRMCEFAAVALDETGYNALKRHHREALYRLNHGPLDYRAASALHFATRETLDIYLANQ